MISLPIKSMGSPENLGAVRAPLRGCGNPPLLVVAQGFMILGCCRRSGGLRMAKVPDLLLLQTTFYRGRRCSHTRE